MRSVLASRRRDAVCWFVAAMIATCAQATAQQSAVRENPPSPSKPTLYTTATAHLDTQWLWTIQTTIDEYIPRTLRDNFDRFEKFPDYVFSFEGAFRYMLAKEYYPDDYARLKDYIAQGRWHVCGSSVDAGDVNVPSPESLIRHILYGNGYFEREFGVRSTDIFLPDCFGFGYALPSVAAHCGLTGFSTQKLTWGSSVGIPFDIGLWEGVDGSTVIAALNPGEYVAKLRGDLSTDEEWLSRINAIGSETGAYIGFKYFGVGDRGGAPDEETVSWLEKAIANDGPIHVINVPPDRLFQDVERLLGRSAPKKRESGVKLPRYKGEMLMTRHGTGCYTSQAAMKRWNRKNEQLADAAERASVVADWLGAAPYPTRRFEEAWIRFLWHQFHDDLTGTSIPAAYPFSWNDEIIALNQFASELENAVGAVARAMDTQTEGAPLVVFNPLSFEREDVVEATVRFADGAPRAIRVYDSAGQEVPSQVNGAHDDTVRILFIAKVPSVGFSVFDVRPASTPYTGHTGLTVSGSSLENAHYRVTIDGDGNVSSIKYGASGRELLSAPIQLQLLHNTPDYWSEWEIRHEDIVADPYATVGGTAKVKILERGPVRATLEVTREAAGSTFIQRIRLAAGNAGDRLEFDTRVDWRTPTTLLKAVFPLTASNPMTTYDLGFGVIERPNNTERLYEVPAQQWADITHTDGSRGVAILNDCKYGWDKPADNTLRLTLVHSPNEIEKEMGWHQFTYAIVGHDGDWRQGEIVQQASRLNQPLYAFQTTPHTGRMGRRFSFLNVDSPQVTVRALKKAENSDEVVVRLQELHGKGANGVAVRLLPSIREAREITGAETPIGQIPIDNGQLDLSLHPYKPCTLALKLQRPTTTTARPNFLPIELPFNTDVVSFDAKRGDGDFDGNGHTLPGELLPDTVRSGGTSFTIGSTAGGADNAVTCRGQKIPLQDGEFDRLYILAAGDETTTATFHLGENAIRKTIRAFDGWIGQSQSLIVNDRLVDTKAMAPAFIHRDEVAWVGTHRHDATSNRNEPYVFCYLFKYGFDVPPGAATITLPDDEQVKILAMTIAQDTFDDTAAAHPLYDELTAIDIEPSGGLSIEPVTVRLAADASAADTKVVYTLDGTLPTLSSPVFSDPLEVAKSTTITARAVRGPLLEDHFVRSTFRITQPREAVRPKSVTPGLTYQYHEGEWSKLPAFDSLTPIQTGTTATFDLGARQRDHEYGFAFTGLLKVPTDGVYTFYTASDDGSKLYVGETEVVNNDGLHGKRERFGEAALSAGFHPIKVTFFERGGDDTLEVLYEGPGIERQIIPADVLAHAP